MAKRIYVTKNRDASHRALEYALGQRVADGPDQDFPGTEILSGLSLTEAWCVDADEKGNYSVWEGPPDAPAPAPQQQAPELNEAFADLVATKLFEKMKNL